MTRRSVAALAVVSAALLAPEAAFAHGDEVPIDELAGAWRFEPLVLALAALGLALYAQAFVRLRRRGRADRATVTRAIAFVAAIAVAVLAVSSPLDAAGEEYLLSAHMFEHGLVGDVAPALLVAAVTGPLLVFLLPAPLLRPLARARWLRATLGFLTLPVVAFVVWCVVYAVWHVPALYDYVLTSRWAHDLQHASFFLAGILLWVVLLDPGRHRRARRSVRLGLAVAVLAAGQILSMVLVFSFDPLYPAYAAQDERLFGLAPITDQRLAGVVMMAEQVVMLGTFCALLLLAAGQESRARLQPASSPALQPRPRP